MKYLIDTDVASYFLRGKFNLDEKFEQEKYENLALSIVTVAELKVLAYKNPNSVINLYSINSLSQFLTLLEPDEETWEIFSMVKSETLTKGRKRGDFDILNAAIAKRNKLVIVTNNISHYEDLVGVKNWITT